MEPWVEVRAILEIEIFAQNNFGEEWESIFTPYYEREISTYIKNGKIPTRQQFSILYDSII